MDIDGIGTLNPFRYRGYYYDTETELYYLNSRYYDPRTCRFISADILLDARAFPGYNLFAYCLNNPVIFHDMGGSFAITIAAGLAALGFLTIGLLYTGSATQASHDLASQSETIDIDNPFDRISEWWKRKQLQKKVTLAMISSTIIRKGLSGIAGNYGNLECDKAAEEMRKYLRRKNEHGAIIILKFLNSSFVLSEKDTSTAISETGIHMGVLYQGTVYCNVYPTGLPEKTWINSFYDASGLPPIVTKIPF